MASVTGEQPSIATAAAASTVARSSRRPSIARSTATARIGTGPTLEYATRTPESRPAESSSLAAMVSSDTPFGLALETLTKRSDAVSRGRANSTPATTARTCESRSRRNSSTGMSRGLYPLWTETLASSASSTAVKSP